MESLDNIILFGMLSYNKESLCSLDVNGYNIKYADVRHFQDMIRLIRKNEDLPSFRYMACSERGGKRHRPHWHFMIFYPKSAISDSYNRINEFHLWHLQSLMHPLFLKYWRTNRGSRRYPLWSPKLTYVQKGYNRNYDLQVIDTVTKDCSDSAFYITKYTTKFDDYEQRLKSAIRLNVNEDDFKDIWSKVRSRFIWSKGFGNVRSPLVYEHIRKGIDYALQHEECFYPIYFSPYSGQQFPLSPYFRKKFVTADEELIFRERILASSPTGVISDAELSEPLTPDQIARKIEAFEHTKDSIRKRDFDVYQYFDYLSEDDFNNDNLLMTDKEYGISKRLTPEDFETSFDW